jgi:hypothetical protein
MDELDDAWAEMLVAASERAALQGRADIAEYLRLKATNDAIRAAGVKWLLEAFIEAAFANPSLKVNVERKEAHSFAHGSATMAGTLLSIRHGVRCVEIEAGWARLPSHGFMRGQALARANILHFGRSRQNESLKLVHGDDLPEWLMESGEIFRLEHVGRHIERLFGD